MTAILLPNGKQQYFTTAGLPAVGYKVATFAAGTSTPQTTWQDALKVATNTNPIILDARGEASIFWDGAYKVQLQDSTGAVIWTQDNLQSQQNGFASTLVPGVTNSIDLGSLTFTWRSGYFGTNLFIGPNNAPAFDLASGNVGYYKQTALELAAAITPVNFSYPVSTPIDMRRYVALITDSATDNTTAITTFFTAAVNYRATIAIPYGTKFTKATVYPAAPVGILLWDNSSVNTGQPPGYKNKHIDQVTNDTVSDDATQGIVSSHHPALRLNNLHTAGSSSATSRFHSVLFAAGYRWQGDAIDGMQYLTSLSTRVAPPSYLWRNSWITNTKAQAAVLSSHWIGATPYPTGSVVDTTDGNVWINNGALGTSAATEPTGTGPTFNDGGITWTWLFAWNVASTLFFFDEDGFGGITGATARWGADGPTRKGPSLNINDSTHDSFIRDDQRAIDFWRCSDTSGLQTGMIRSLSYSGALTGATPTISGDLHTVNNAGATNMTNLVLPGTQTRGVVTLYFTNSNTTLKATGFALKGGVDVTPASGNIMSFFKEPSISGSWQEVTRNF